MKSKLFSCIFLILLILGLRLIPHVPNFSPIIALFFYVPILLGLNFLPLLIVSYVLTDILLSFHETLIFVWVSLILIGLFSKNFKSSVKMRCLGIFTSVILFYLLTNFGVWLTGSHDAEKLGFVNTYFIAIPFFKNTLISTIVSSTVLEIIYKIYKIQKLKLNIFSKFNKIFY